MLDHLVQSARHYASIAASAATDAARETGQFIRKHREVIAGGVGGYMAGRALESIPVFGKLLRPVASIVMGIGGSAYGYQKMLERRHVEALERGTK